MMSVHTHTTTPVHLAIFMAWAQFYHIWQRCISLIAYYSVIKMCFKILFGDMIYHIVINILKAFCFFGCNSPLSRTSRSMNQFMGLILVNFLL